MYVIRSLLFYLLFYGASVFHVLGAVTAAKVYPPALRPICDAWSKWHHWCTEHVLGIRIVITGTQPAGCALFAVKHESVFEAIEMPHLFDHPCGFAKQELFEIPGWGRAARTYGCIPVARDQGASALRTMLKEARPRIAENRPLIIFPEGTRVKPGQRPPLQSGFAALYKLLGLPVVPVAVDSGPIFETLWKRPGTIHLHFHDPIPPGLPREEIEERVHTAINSLNLPEAPAAI